MQRAILSPCLLKVPQNSSNEEEFLHYVALKELIDALFLFTKLRFEYYKKAPYEGFKMEIPHYSNNFTLNNLVTVNIFSVIQKMMIHEYVDLEGISPARCTSQMNLPEGDLTEAFLSYLNYIQGEESLLFIGHDNLNIARPLQFFATKEFKIETSTFIKIELTNVMLPFLKDNFDKDDIFPRKRFCAKYNDYVLNKIKFNGLSINESISIFQEIGALVAFYNCYEKDIGLSAKNSSGTKLRTVYKKTVGKVYYLSIDVESGGFEVFDRNFVHLGQYNFSCELAKQADSKTHKLHR
ncbi:hypothetical protein MHI24_07700 [Paenibacillus sp. FSL K6-1096]|uniref:hypothetical protein n=1 Tax=Paenibacillus sp. FSL K6-1096 TaxID=2921460 RepID=UPI0030EBA714